MIAVCGGDILQLYWRPSVETTRRLLGGGPAVSARDHYRMTVRTHLHTRTPRPSQWVHGRWRRECRSFRTATVSGRSSGNHIHRKNQTITWRYRNRQTPLSTSEVKKTSRPYSAHARTAIPRKKVRHRRSRVRRAAQNTMSKVARKSGRKYSHALKTLPCLIAIRSRA